jgi:peptidoglycan/LPS O-acetylase OafA/YrhL
MSTTTPWMTSQASVTLTFRPDIAGLRAVAVGLVVLFHAGVQWLPGGYVGVDVFLVISGYLMTALLTNEINQTRRIRLLPFYARRIHRLLPAAVLILVTTLVAAKVLLPAIELHDIAVETAVAAASVATFVPTVGWLCTDRCDPLVANVVIYRDRHYVTATFAGMLRDRFRQVINAAAR